LAIQPVAPGAIFVMNVTTRLLRSAGLDDVHAEMAPASITDRAPSDDPASLIASSSVGTGPVRDRRLSSGFSA
jgi:hypothetical protein